MSLLSLLDHGKQAVTSPFESKPQAQSTGVKALAASSPAGGSGAASPASSATITSNDFLTLLVTEIQNQNPTTQTDPMQYITQLVGVNSLEQLVQINQTLTGTTGAASSSASSAARSTAANIGIAAAIQPGAAPSSTSMAEGARSPASATGSSAASHLLPLGSNAQIPAAAETAVAHAFTHASTLPTQVVPPTEVPLNPEVMRALEHSIPGATFAGQTPLPAASPAGEGGALR